MEGKNVLMKVKYFKDSELRQLKRHRKLRRFDKEKDNTHYAYYDMAYFPFKATQTSELFF